MDTLDLPPFFSESDEGARFYTLAYCRGHYPRHRDPSSVAFLSIIFSTSPDFTHYSLAVNNAEGRLLAYRRGDDVIDSLEYSLLIAAEEFDVSTAYWQLYPLGEMSSDFWTGYPADHDLYLASRRQLCRILWHFRVEKQSKEDSLPLFIRDRAFTPPSLIDEPFEGDAIEINGVMDDLAADGAEDHDG